MDSENVLPIVHDIKNGPFQCVSCHQPAQLLVKNIETRWDEYSDYETEEEFFVLYCYQCHKKEKEDTLKAIAQAEIDQQKSDEFHTFLAPYVDAYYELQNMDYYRYLDGLSDYSEEEIYYFYMDDEKKKEWQHQHHENMENKKDIINSHIETWNKNHPNYRRALF